MSKGVSDELEKLGNAVKGSELGRAGGQDKEKVGEVDDADVVVLEGRGRMWDG